VLLRLLAEEGAQAMDVDLAVLGCLR
jgi:hypothetical protein